MPLITKQYKFCAAHKYWNPNWDENKNISIFQEDVRLHGHNYELDITIGGPINQDSGFIINIMDLNKIVDEYVISKLDHSHIDQDIDWFSEKQPSTENIVVFIWEQIADKIPVPAHLHSIKLRETPTIFTEYYGPEGEE
ncbi:MAG: 6-pyruvoyl tetrahydrobiopterin synthase [Candidatus Marinimicrobia bacterium]|nr:6-pyruvoyl tetrahydrobiopterin synthase [Candidatus Neomarinimicrobiota bacterium]MAR29565.1 6-pyruvoyl tetrahydrobiopterin synthase [Candidatus Neomarinimicrobiota bacterium]|tara:strand:+ start:497 stop:913 length:417 start_codon:yes stop_codon:yes gene_type:complete